MVELANWRGFSHPALNVKGGASMKRILVLRVVALMVVMLAMSVAPAFAAWDAQGGQCRTGGHLIATGGNPVTRERRPE